MSNRQERRRRAGSSHRPGSSGVQLPKGTTLDVRALTPTGETAHVTNLRQMPRKRPGVHRWQAFVVHALSEEQCEAIADGGGQVLFDGSSVVMFPVPYCVDCEGVYAVVKGTPCPAGDEWDGGPDEVG